MGRRAHRRNTKTLVLTTLVAGLFGSGVLFLWAATLTLPDLKSFEGRKVEQSTKIYDRTGEVLLYDLHRDIQRTVVPFSEMSRNIKNATVAIEDAEFYEHIGVRPLATFRAVFIQPLRGKGVQGGSTITQQVVKNSLLTADKTIARKLKEWVLAIKLERALSKEQILELYLNESPYGGSMYGIEEASQSFFGKAAVELSLPEAAYLAALPQAPTYYSPYGNHKDKLEERKNLVLEKMYGNGFITQEERASAKEVTVEFKPPRESGILAPHFVFFVREYLEEKYGERAIEERGLTIITSIDYELQKRAEEIVHAHALENEEKFNAENAGLVAIDPRTGQILAMVGSRDYFDPEIDGNFNVALARRQPGSAFKPFVYATALKKGYTPETVVFDVATQFSTLCTPENLSNEDPCYAPSNYDNVYRGPVSFRNALAQSINVPSVKVFYLAGLTDSLRTAKDLGITTLTDIGRYGLTLVLGGGEVSLLDMTSAYGVFANEGIRLQPAAILRIEDRDGEALEEFSPHPTRVLPEDISLVISDMLSDNEARSPAFGEASYLYFPGRDVAAKTGTTNDYRDAWIVGYTPSLVVGAWAGNNNNSSMEKRVAGFIVAPLWNAFMNEAIPRFPLETFKEPPPRDTSTLKPIFRGKWQGGVSYFVDMLSGKLATEFTPPESREERVTGEIHSILFWVDRDNPLGPGPTNPAADPQFAFWEAGVARFLAARGVSPISSTPAPTEYDDLHRPEFAPQVAIVGLASAGYTQAEKISLQALVSRNRFPIKQVDYFIDGVFAGSAGPPSYSLSLELPSLNLSAGEHSLRAEATDAVLNKGVQEVLFLVRER